MATVPKERKRACDSCYRRKIQCDGSSNKCNWCEHHGLACTFNRPVRGKKAGKIKKDSEKIGLSERIGKLEQMLTETVGRPNESLAQVSNSALDLAGHVSPAPSPLPDLTAGAHLATGTFRDLHFAGHYLGEVASWNGMPLFSASGQGWIHSRTGAHAAFPILAAPIWQNPQHTHEAMSALSKPFDMPDKSVVLDYLEVYCSSSVHAALPMVDRILFKDTIEEAYAPMTGPTCFEHIRAKACVLSFLCFVARVEGKIEANPVDFDMCAVQAQYALPQLVIEPTIVGLQALLMQGVSNLFSGSYQAAAMFHSLASRMMLMLGAHTQVNDLESEALGPAMDIKQRVQNHLRKYFWMCYTLDKDIALRTGHPPSIDDQFCRLNLPKYCGYSDPSTGPDVFDSPTLPGDLGLTLIKSKVIRLLNSFDTLEKSDTELLRETRELDDELERWRLSVDPRYRPTLSTRAEDPITDPDIDAHQKTYCVITNFAYHHLVTTLHAATSRCRAWCNRESGAMEGVSSSLALAVESSRSTLVYLRAAARATKGELFWLVVYYPMSAVLTVFCNLLLHPLSDRAEDDLELLRSVPELIRSIRIRRLTAHEAMHMKMSRDVIAEFVRLGGCAIEKAREEQSPCSSHSTLT